MAHDVNGTWEIAQSNGWRVWVTIAQPSEAALPGEPGPIFIDGDLTGTADEVNPQGAVTVRQVPLSGEIIQDAFELEIAWGNGTKGRYNGTFDLEGRLSGVTFDEANPTSQATWFRPAP
jgi:hypothetical protein